MQRWLNKWINNYVDGDPANSSEATKAQQALAAAEVVVEEVEGNAGLLHVQVLPQAALSARRADRFAPAGVQAAIRKRLKGLSPLRTRSLSVCLYVCLSTCRP
jgi:hypothetical protein